MINPGIPRNLQFRVETMYAGNGSKIGRIKPDENGIYCGLPMMVLGEVTQQNTYYDPATMINQIVNPDTNFNKIFRQQKKKGEYGHPSFYNLKDNDKIQRLMEVDEDRVSHLFTKIYTDAPVGNTVVVRADLKPTGPKGAIFKQELDDPIVNTAFSLRAFVDTELRQGVKYRMVRSLTTWDTVGASGFAGTDKAHSVGLESFSGEHYNEFDITILENGNLVIDQIALETFTESELNEIFGVSKVSKIIQSRTMIKPDVEQMQRFPNLYTKSIFNDFFKE